MKILYTNPAFRLKNNGWISKTCKMKRGIRQGCPISALLYIFVAEILAKKIKSATVSVVLRSVIWRKKSKIFNMQMI